MTENNIGIENPIKPNPEIRNNQEPNGKSQYIQSISE